MTTGDINLFLNMKTKGWSNKKKNIKYRKTKQRQKKDQLFCLATNYSNFL